MKFKSENTTQIKNNKSFSSDSINNNYGKLKTKSSNNLFSNSSPIKTNSPHVNFTNLKYAGSGNLKGQYFNKCVSIIYKKADESNNMGSQAVSSMIKTGETAYVVLKTSNKINKIAKEKLSTTASTVAKNSVNAINISVKTYKLTRAVLKGNVKLKIDRKSLQSIRNRTVDKMKKAPLSLAKKSVSTVPKTTKLMLKASSKVNQAFVDTLDQSEDLGVQAFSAGLKTAKFTKDTIKATPKIAKLTLKTVKVPIRGTVKFAKKSYKVGKGIYSGYRFARKNGLRNATKHYRKKAKKTAQYAGKEAGKAIIKLGYNALRSILVSLNPLMPVITTGIAIAIAIYFTSVSAPSNAVMAMFSGALSVNKGNNQFDNVEEHTYITNKCSEKREELINNILALKEQLKDDYQIIKFVDEETGVIMEVTRSNLDSILPTTAEFTDMIEPIFHCRMVFKYDLEPTDADMDSNFNELWDIVTQYYTQEQPTEYCGEKHADGYYHANADCLHKGSVIYHTSNSGESCCYEITTEDSEGSAETEFHCNGFTECLGHKVIHIKFKNSGISALLNKDYLDRLNYLKGSNVSSEQKEYDELSDQYQFCLDYIEFLTGQTYSNTSGSGTGSSSGGTGGSGYVLDDNTTGAQIVNYALQYVGNPYVYGGTSITNGIDCSAFTQYVFAQFGISLPRTSYEQRSVGVAVSSLSEAQPGDIICYEGHVAIYMGNNQIVHASNSKPYPAGGIKVSNNAGYRYIVTIRRLVK